MTDEELNEMHARAVVLERLHGDNWAQCPHERPYERCESCGGEDVFALVAEVRRLRGLIKSAEFCGLTEWTTQARECCPWCAYNARMDTKRKHAPECPAFTESGAVR